jgi:hypothetical protein
LVAGVAVGADAGFGNELDVKAPGADNLNIVSKIASVTIGGTVSASTTIGEHFGIVAQLIAKAKLGTTLYSLDKLPNGQIFPVVTDVVIREVAV